MTPRFLALLAAAALLAGCASFEKKPPPEDLGAAPPEEEEVAPDPEPAPAEAAKPPDPAPAEAVKPPEPAKPADPPPNQELPGSWTLHSASGPGSAPVRHADMEFGADGAWCGSMLVEVEGKKRFQSLEGAWKLENGKVTLRFSDGRERVWSTFWDGAVLVLKDGEAELRLRRSR